MINKDQDSDLTALFHLQKDVTECKQNELRLAGKYSRRIVVILLILYGSTVVVSHLRFIRWDSQLVVAVI